MKDLKHRRNGGTAKLRYPVYGEAGNDALVAKVTRHLELGLPVPFNVLRTYLIEYLVEEGRYDILQMISTGKYDFGPSWAQRFWARNKFPSRAVRETEPADFLRKR